MTQPCRNRFLSYIRQLELGEAHVLPALRIHKVAAKLSLTEDSYSALVHAMWAAVNHHDYGILRLRAIKADLDAEVAEAIGDAREILNTAIAKRESVVMMIPVATAGNMLEIGYKLRFACVDGAGNALPASIASIGVVNNLPSIEFDPSTSWRPIRDWRCAELGRLIGMNDVPDYMRYRFHRAG